MQWSFAGFRRKMFEQSEFFSSQQDGTKWREPAVAAGYGRQGVRVRFFASFFVAQQKMKASSGAATPRF